MAGTIPTPTPPGAGRQAPGRAAGVTVDLNAAVAALDRRIDREPDLLVCPLDGPARYWPLGTHPHLDAPRTGKDLPPDVTAIATAAAPQAPRA